jgi:hypothetical protein
VSAADDAPGHLEKTTLRRDPFDVELAPLRSGLELDIDFWLRFSCSDRQRVFL